MLLSGDAAGGRMNARLTMMIPLATMAGGAVLGYAFHVRADGIPDSNPLYYTGTLTESGQLVSGQRAITVNVWSDGTTPGAPLCQTVASTAQVVGGRFRIALSSSCKDAVNKDNNAWVEVIDGATSLGRAKIGAVPYAVEADHAVSATTATNATNALTTVGGSEINAMDSFGQNCLTGMDAVSCSVAANRKCVSLKYASGWFVGEWGSSHDGNTRTISCIK
jgi:hypothetical protein